MNKALLLLAPLALIGLFSGGSARKAPGGATFKSPGVDERLLRVAERAKELGADFRITAGLRSVEDQIKALGGGASRFTSDPETAPHVLGRAIDVLAPEPRTNEWAAYVELARLFGRAGAELGVPIRWGGAWDTILNGTDDPVAQSKVYTDRKKREGESPFIDPGHFELG